MHLCTDWNLSKLTTVHLSNCFKSVVVFCLCQDWGPSNKRPVPTGGRAVSLRHPDHLPAAELRPGRHQHRDEPGAEEKQKKWVHDEGQRPRGLRHLQEQEGRKADGLAEAAPDPSPSPQVSAQYELFIISLPPPEGLNKMQTFLDVIFLPPEGKVLKWPGKTFGRHLNHFVNFVTYVDIPN